MLGKLFNLSAGAGQPSISPEPVSTLESVQEDVHTRNLLYPDTQALYQHRHDQVFPLLSSPHLPATGLASAFDYDGEIDLDMRDVRVVVMQDVLSSIPSCVLYDSQPPPPSPASYAGSDRPATMTGLSHLNFSMQEPSRRVPTSPRKPSLSHGARPLVIQPDSPQLRQSATFDRRPSLHSRSQSRLETEAQRAYREYTDELATFSSCMFGNSELIAYRGTSTKLHVLPSETRPDPSYTLFHDGRGSLGRSSMRSSKLSQSFSSESTSMFAPPPPTSSSSSITTGSSRNADRKKVLITRLFPITLPIDEEGMRTATPAAARAGEDSVSSSSGAGYPFPVYSEDGSVRSHKKKKLKQKRTPMYAIGLIVNVPQPPSAAFQALSASRSTFRGPGSYSEQESFPSSYGSGRRVGLAMAAAAVGGGLGIDTTSMDSTAAATASTSPYTAATDQEEHKDPLTQHWDIIMRTLTHMQEAVSATVSTLLRSLDVSSPDLYPIPLSTHMSRTTSISGRRSEDGGGGGGGGLMKAPKSNAKLLSLMPNALMDMERIAQEVDGARVRIVVGLRALRVVTGQNRWGIWRDEARWVSRWAASVKDQLQQQLQQISVQKRQDDFLYRLLTAFLSTHTDWLQALSPVSYRKRHMLLQSVKGDDVALPARTVIVSQDRAAARRIIFLLSAFLPATQTPSSTLRMHRPSTSLSWGALSQSPPASFVVPLLKEESLRRKINRRGGSGRRSSHSRNLSLQGQGGSGGGGGSGSASASASGSAHRSTSASAAGVPAPLAHLSMSRGNHERRPSDTLSIRTANLPISGNDINTRKSSAATMTAITSETTVPHFATLQRADSSFTRPDSSASSLAADDLKRTLYRGDSSSSQYSQLLQQQLHSSASGSSTGTDSRSQSSRWGSVLSGFLSGRRRDSTNAGAGGHSRNSSASSWDPRGRPGSLTPSSPTKLRGGWSDLQFQQLPPPPRPVQPPVQTLPQENTAAEGTAQGQAAAAAIEDAADAHTPRLSYDASNMAQGRGGGGGGGGGGAAAAEPVHRTPDPEGAYESPMKTSINPEDGVIDVDIQFPDYIRSFETAVSSPSSSGFLSTPGIASGLDAFEQSFRASVDGDLPVNVAGWLQAYHPDFLLQAIPTQDDLLAQVKESLRAEPTPTCVPLQPDPNLPYHVGELPQQQQARWVDVSNAIIVDTTSLTITRLHYSRLVRPKTREPSTPNSGGGSFVPSSTTSQTSSPLHETPLEEKFVQEDITYMEDSVLTKAVERVISQSSATPGTLDLAIVTSNDSGELGSKGSSSSASVFQDRSNSTSLGSGDSPQLRPRSAQGPSVPLAATPVTQEVPRAECKAVILSALEEIVGDVVHSREGWADQETELEPSILRDAVKSWLDSIDMGEI